VAASVADGAWLGRLPDCVSTRLG